MDSRVCSAVAVQANRWASWKDTYVRLTVPCVGCPSGCNDDPCCHPSNPVKQALMAAWSLRSGTVKHDSSVQRLGSLLAATARSNSRQGGYPLCRVSKTYLLMGTEPRNPDAPQAVPPGSYSVHVSGPVSADCSTTFCSLVRGSTVICRMSPATPTSCSSWLTACRKISGSAR